MNSTNIFDCGRDGNEIAVIAAGVKGERDAISIRSFQIVPHHS